MIAAMDARHQRAEFSLGGFPSANHDLLSGAAFRFGPVLGPAGTIRRTELFRDDAFQRELARRLQNRLTISSGLAVTFEMLDIPDQFGFSLSRLQQLLQTLLSLAKQKGTNIHSIREQQIEREENKVAGLAVRYRRLQR